MYLECTLIPWRLSIYPEVHKPQVAVGTFFIKSPEAKYNVMLIRYR